MNQLKLRKFNPRVIEARRTNPDAGPATIIIVGSRGKGKSYLMKDLLYYVRNIPAGMMITGSEASAESFSEVFPKTFIFDDLETERLKNIISNQRKLRKKGTTEDYSSLLLLDDCGYNRSVMKEKPIKQIFCNGRHLKIMLVVSVQYCKDIPPDLRSNADYVFILREPQLENRRKLWKDFAGIVPTFELFNTVMNECTNDYGMIVLDNTTISNNITDNLFWYRARETPRKYKIGSRDFWNFHNKNYKSEDDDVVGADTKPKPVVCVKRKTTAKAKISTKKKVK